MLYSVDRLEGELAVLVDEDGNSLTLSREALPSDARAGSMLRRVGESYTLAPTEEEDRRRRVLELQQRLRKEHKN